ncbi:LacI family DNA-binding transcriptional regulator [Motilimonas cestriensis]|uniref:LacI family DNA-binding transcriptional regulator n=1 Tax=Motilimonas cestriensis TaxID=2742685 RepID=A0ABS8WFQ5_9GAMM|nr:LacI family DNA-binding transcriptional regulator [Motilimonas cestriensis]MCE2596571.1 LacI family DNA-binding transcriptional regulator [Motilimonas cestriensis]
MSQGKKRKNSGRVTLADVAKLAGVGSMTVSRALRTPDLVSTGLREKIDAAVAQLGYLPNKAAGALASSQSDIVAVILPSLTEFATNEIVLALKSVLEPAGYQLIFTASNYDSQEEEKQVRALLQHSPAALILPGTAHTSQTLKYIENISLPVVELSALTLTPVHINVGVDHHASAYQLTKFLYMKGYRHIGFIGAYTNFGRFAMRLAGWQKAMIDHDMASHRLVLGLSEVSFSVGAELLMDTLARWPDLDAVICSHSELAAGLILEANKQGVKVPEQLAIATFEDPNLCNTLQPSLTTVDIPYADVGTQAAEALLQALIAGNRDKVVKSLGFRVKTRAST